MSESIIEGIPAEIYMQMEEDDLEICKHIMASTDFQIIGFNIIKDENYLKTGAVSVMHFDKCIISIHYSIDVAFINFRCNLLPDQASRYTMILIDALMDKVKGLNISENFWVDYEHESGKPKIVFGKAAQAKRDIAIWEMVDDGVSQERFFNELLESDPPPGMLEH